MAKRGQTGLSALIAIDKPSGLTSHDVVNAVRRRYGERRVGHAGTLDPMATGVLVVGIGPATRLTALLSGDDKVYHARICFGTATSTDDAEGDVVEQLPVPDEVGDPFEAAGFIASLVGEHEQIPPAYSAIKKNGKKAYELARKGEEVRLDARTIAILDARLLGVGQDAGGSVYWDAEFAVSKGTYVRSLARDVGRALGTCAHLSELRRVRSGLVDISQAVTLKQLERLPLDEICLNPVRAIGAPAVLLGPRSAQIVSNGGRVSTTKLNLPDTDIISFVHDGKLIAVYRREGSVFRPQCVLAEGVQGVG